MPSSHPFQLNEILELILIADPQSLLDIGVGFGKYGYLSREYLELWNSGNDYLKWTRQIDGIEGFEAYLTPIHDQVYNTIYKGDALTILPEISQRYDLILMIDVLEHFTYSDGIRVLDLCLKKGKNILVSVPKNMSVQDEVYGNPYESHKFQWKKNDFHHLSDKFFIPNEKSILCFIGEDSRRIGELLKKKKFRKRVIRILTILQMKEPVRRILKRFSNSRS